MVVLISAYEPDERLPRLVADLTARGHEVLVVDDGSGPAFDDVFAAATGGGAIVTHHDRNRGKGAAIRTGLREVARRSPGADVVTADCDGQHLVADIERVAEATAATRSAIVLGARRFDGPSADASVGPPDGGGPARVPLRSRLGNVASSRAFALATGGAVSDTQTGLRGYPATLRDWLLELPGDRFEYEFRMLLRARGAGWDLVEVPIQTVYLDRNASSHFRPIVDSLRVWAPLGRFIASALLAFAVDTLAVVALTATTGSLLLAVVAARLLSAAVNYTVNRTLVFRTARARGIRSTLVPYACLALLVLTANYGLLTALTDAGLPLLAAKVLTEGTLFLISFQVQRRVVFANAEAPARAEGPWPAHAVPVGSPVRPT
ncbi:GtrA family protein [Agromyces sp. MMS24-K17]|uniref:GtrA family protein n=1 Tax=Agromyces sp. MMS24-K17 TaxID=3372850 RepID=UPI003754BD8A